MPEDTVVTVDSVLEDLTNKVAAVEKANADLKTSNANLTAKVAELQNQIDKNTNEGSLTDIQLKKIQDLLTRLSALSS